jgi:hypothetical protein
MITRGTPMTQERTKNDTGGQYSWGHAVTHLFGGHQKRIQIFMNLNCSMCTLGTII